MTYGIQMFSLHDMTAHDLEGALRAVSEMGYSGVEFAGFFGHSAEEVRNMLEKYHLTCVASHSRFDDLLHDFEGTVQYHKTIGNTKFVLPGYDLSTREKLEIFIAQCQEILPKLREQGIEMGFHNHAKEFLEQSEGYYIHKELEERTEMFFELDTYWVFVAQQDPIATLERLGDRVKMIHLKDGSADGRHGYSLGSGEAPVAAVLQKAIEMGLDIVVESEGCAPTGIAEVERCMAYLKAADPAQS